jgi:hypothetical protein
MIKIGFVNFIDVILQLLILVISYFILYFFIHESKLHGDSRLYLVFIYVWYFSINLIFIILQLFHPLRNKKHTSLIKRKKNNLIIQYVITFLPILLFSYNRGYSEVKIIEWSFLFGIFIVSSVVIYVYIAKKMTKNTA